MFMICGEALYDLFLVEARPDGAMTLDARIGGSPFNLAMGLARLGRPAGLFGGISTDPLGERLTARLEAEGVEPRFLRRKSELSTLSLVAADAAGVPAYAFYGVGAADRALTLDDLPTEAGMEGVKAIHFGSYALVAPPTSETLAALAAREAGRRFFSLDPNLRLNVEPDREVWRRRLEALIPLTDLVKVSDEDLRLLHPESSAEEVAAAWLKLGPALVVVTRGAEGAFALAASGARAEIPAEKIALIDTVGAGDSFMAALLAGLEETGRLDRARLAAIPAGELAELLRFCARASGLTCARRGADPPRRAELPALPTPKPPHP
ncbi:carbohydrate kinase [Neomegalonema sp.]|uniref:carbohydrate kinase family protein n=1 Tax=Neomegalonema sp. TaxID=2039713 RepID=UPI002617A36B|nr:carbohydrate kinase [Neomegalonema sp.]MDD2869514.1 carbohydrate kinase [Neomegalonema sp.]